MSRSKDVMFSDSELVDRYRSNYRIPKSVPLTIEMVMGHWSLERELTAELLASTSDTRWQTAVECYTRLYAELPWLNIGAETDHFQSPGHLWADIRSLLPPPPAKVYEIGAGRGELIAYLAGLGYICTAAEITPERGKRWIPGEVSISWHTTDGVHLYQFEAAEYYDVVISSHVIEHFHPDDIQDHFRSVFLILRKGGRYIVATPHRFAGPSDLSRVFGYEEACCLHLREYTYTELDLLARRACFRKIQAIFSIRRLGRLVGLSTQQFGSSAYLKYIETIEWFLGRLPSPRLRKQWARLVGRIKFPGSILLVMEK